jgi:YVTN family beta-propeller protein
VPHGLLRLVLALSCLLHTVAALAVPITITYGNQDGDGFFDPVRGPARRSAFEFAVGYWERALAGAVPITITATMDPLGGSGGDALLARAGAVTLHRNFAGAAPDTWYGAALANELSGVDLNGADTAEISIMFNADVDGPEVLGSIGWYYGTDAQPGTDIDFATIALHELGHGLNFFELVDSASGAWRSASNQPGIFDRMLFRPQVGLFAGMRDAERLAAIISPPLLWVGNDVGTFNGTAPALFTPDPAEPGSSVGHWDPTSAPGELMAPFYGGAVHDAGLLLPALADMGWQLAIPSPTPRAPTIAPTATATPTASAFPPPPRTPPPRRDQVYVANFDDGTVSVVDPTTFTVTATIPVEHGPVGVAATSDGRRIYVANFQAGTVSMIGTRSGQVVATFPVGASANGVAVSADGANVVVTDTFADEAVIIDALNGRTRARVHAGQAPAGIVLSPDGALAFVADYGEASVAVIDVVNGLRRGIIATGQPNLLAITIAAETGTGYVVGVPDSTVPSGVLTLDTNALTAQEQQLGSSQRLPARPQAVAIRNDGSEAYIAGYSLDNQTNEVAIIAPTANQVSDSIRTGTLPDTIALSTDGNTLYVSNMGSNSLSIVNPRFRSSTAVAVGGAPMGVAVAAVPSICDGDCNGDREVVIDELIRGVAVALEQQSLSSCDAADHDDDGRVMVDEILRATRAALLGCPTAP